MTILPPEAFVTEEGIPVQMPSGGQLFVLTQAEVDYLEDRSRRYLTDQRFVNVSDLMDIDRMLMVELLVFRYGLWLSRGRDYFDEPVDNQSLRKWMLEASRELRQIKTNLGIDKTTRDKSRGSDSVAAYLENLRRRAREFGVHREKQLAKALELTNELIGLITVNGNADDVEKRELGVTDNDVLEWIRNVYIPEFEVIDAHFRENQQRFWVRDL